MSVFSPSSTTVSVTATTTTQTIILAPTFGGSSIRVANPSGFPVFIAFGRTDPVTVTTTSSMPILGGTVEVFEVPPDAVYVGVRSAANNSSTIYFTRGDGA